MTATKSLSPEQNRLVVGLLRKLKGDYGTQEEFATALGIAQGTLSGLMNAKSGKRAGGKVLAGLSRIASHELTAIMGGKPLDGAPNEREGDTLSMAREAAENLVVAKLA